MNLPIGFFVMLGLSAVSGVIWLKESRDSGEDGLTSRGRTHRRLTFTYMAIAAFLFFVFR